MMNMQRSSVVQNFFQRFVQCDACDIAIHSFLLVKFLYISVRIYAANILCHSLELSIGQRLLSMIFCKTFEHNIAHYIDETVQNANTTRTLGCVTENSISEKMKSYFDQIEIQLKINSLHIN